MTGRGAHRGDGPAPQNGSKAHNADIPVRRSPTAPAAHRASGGDSVPTYKGGMSSPEQLSREQPANDGGRGMDYAD